MADVRDMAEDRGDTAVAVEPGEPHAADAGAVVSEAAAAGSPRSEAETEMPDAELASVVVDDAPQKDAPQKDALQKDAPQKDEPAPESAPAPPDPPPDGGRTAWSQVVANFFIQFFGVGFSTAFGVLVRFYISTGFFGPGINQTAVSLINGVGGCVGFIIAPFVGTFADRYGYRLISVIGAVIFAAFNLVAGFSNGSYAVAFLFQGPLSSIGFMMNWIPSVGTVAQWFTTRRGLAISIGGAGSGLGGLAMASLTQYLLDRLGFQWAIVTLSGILLATLSPCALILRTRLAPKRRKFSVDFSSFKDPTFVLLWAACFSCYFAFPLPLVFLPSYASQSGIAASTAALVLGVNNATSAPARISWGWLMDRIGAVNVFALACAVAAISCFALAPFAKSEGLLFLFAILYGGSGGCFMIFPPTTTAHLFGVAETASKLGLIYLSLAVGALLGTFSGGQILASHTYGGSTDYTAFWMFCGTAWACGCVLLLGLKVRLKGWRVAEKV
ncbi:major facilitator superfamily domain-containing protein [Hyaloraphidium curvatum]|nr:major facilitator superfamily domain-containing protein [Hyaloraphidium curvatum]